MGAILRAGVVYDAVACERCGAKLYPASLMKGHMLIHLLKDVRYEQQKADLTRYFTRMRKLQFPTLG